MAEIKNNSDIGITCTSCGALFSGQGQYHEEILKMFNKHPCMTSRVDSLISLDKDKIVAQEFYDRFNEENVGYMCKTNGEQYVLDRCREAVRKAAGLE